MSVAADVVRVRASCLDKAQHFSIPPGLVPLRSGSEDALAPGETESWDLRLRARMAASLMGMRLW